MKRNKIVVRPIDRKRLRQEFELFKELYNTAWDKNWGFVPMTPTRTGCDGRKLGPVLRSLTSPSFAEVAGDPAGFVLGIPDFNQVLQKGCNPRPGVPEPDFVGTRGMALEN